MWKWQAVGEAKGVIVLIHSAYEEHRRYAWQIEKWRTNGFHVYMGDLPGHGTQAFQDGVHQEPFFEYDKAAGELLRLAAETALPIILIGHGLGAAIAIHALADERHPVSGVVVSSPWLQLQKLPVKSSSPLAAISKLSGRRKIDHGIELRHLTRRKFEEADTIIESRITSGWWKELQAYMEQAAQTTIPNLPMMLHVGQRDLITQTSASRAWLSRQAVAEFHFKEWAHCYHDLFQEPERDDIFQSSLSFANAAVEAKEKEN